MNHLLAHPAVSGVIAADWDLKTFLESAKNYLVDIGGLIIALLGIAIMIVALYHIFKKFTSTQPGGGESWGKIVAMVIVGGAMFAGGGWALYQNIAKGGEKTINDAGTSFIHMISMSGLLG